MRGSRSSLVGFGWKVGYKNVYKGVAGKQANLQYIYIYTISRAIFIVLVPFNPNPLVFLIREKLDNP